MKKFSVQVELQSIGQMLRRAEVIEHVRREVHTVLRQRRAKVIDGAYAYGYDGKNYDVIVTNIEGCNDSLIARRLREKMPNLEINELVRGALGIRTARSRSHNVKGE